MIAAALAVLVVVQSLAIVVLYHRRLQDRDMLLEERDGRLIDQWRDLEARDARIAALERRGRELEEQVRHAHERWAAALAPRGAGE